MPIYVYECEKCKEKSEHIVSINDASDKVCDKCGDKAKKVPIVSTGAPVFKGKGFYATDYPKRKS